MNRGLKRFANFQKIIKHIMESGEILPSKRVNPNLLGFRPPELAGFGFISRQLENWEFRFLFKIRGNLPPGVFIKFHLIPEGKDSFLNFDFYPFPRSEDWQSGQIVCLKRIIEISGGRFSFRVGLATKSFPYFDYPVDGTFELCKTGKFFRISSEIVDNSNFCHKGNFHSDSVHGSCRDDLLCYLDHTNEKYFSLTDSFDKIGGESGAALRESFIIDDPEKWYRETAFYLFSLSRHTFGYRFSTVNKIANEFVKPGMHVLDYGCGVGAEWYEVRRRNGSFNISFADIKISKHFDFLKWRLARSKLPAITIELPYHISSITSKSYDIIYSTEVISLVYDWQQLIHQWHKWLKPGGLLFISNSWSNSIIHVATKYGLTPDNFHREISLYFTKEVFDNSTVPVHLLRAY